jgi:hypothetical protein
MANQFGHAEHAAERLRRAIQRMSVSTRMMFGGALTAGLGVGLATAFKSPLQEANKFAKLQNDILTNGAKLAQLKGITDWANNDKSIRNLSVNEKMGVAVEAFALTRDAGRDDVHHTLRLAPILAKMEAIDKASGKHTSDAERQSFVKALELSGGFNNGVDTEARADLLYKLMASGNGTLRAGTLRAIFAGDPADLQKVSNGFLARAEPIMQQMGPGFAVALRTLQNRMLAHVGFNGPTGGYQLEKLKKWGVMDKGGHVIDSPTLIHDTDKWVQTHMPEFYKAAGANDDASRRMVDQIIGSSTGAKLIGNFQRESSLMEASEKAVGKQKGIDESLKTKGSPLDQQMTVLSAKWHDLMLRIGIAVLPMAIKGLSKLAGIMESVAGFAKEHPGLVKVVAVSAAIFAAFLVVGGVIALVVGTVTTLAGALGLGGGLAWVIGGLAVAIPIVTGLLVGLWDGIRDMWKHRPTWLGGDGAVNEPPKPGVNGATQADYSYYAALNGVSTNVKTAAQAGAGGKSGDVYLDGKKVGAVLDKHLAKGAGSLASSNTFDFSMGQVPAGMAY